MPTSTVADEVPVRVAAAREERQIEVAGDIVPGGPVRRPAARVRTRAVKQVGGEEDHGPGRAAHVDRQALVHVAPRAVGVFTLALAVGDELAGPVAGGDDAEAAVVDGRFVKVNG